MSKTQDRSYFRFMTLCYVVALALIAMLSIGGYLVLNNVIDSQDKTSTLINVSGRQRRLSVTIAYYTSQLVSLVDANARQTIRGNMLGVIKTMAESHEALTTKSGAMGLPTNMSPAVENFYFKKPGGLDADVRTYLDHARKIAALSDPQLIMGQPDVAYVNAVGANSLVHQLDLAVHQNEKEAKEQISKIKSLEMAFLFFTILLLAGEALLIFFPMAHTLQNQVNELVDSKLELDAVFNTVGDALIIFGSDRRVQSANLQVRRLFGHNESALVGQPIDNLFTENKEFVAIAGTEVMGKFMESEAIHANGEKVPIEAVVTQSRLSERTLYIASLRDITERREAYQRVSDFYSIVAHELRSPVSSIQGSLQILQSGLAGPLSDKAKLLVDGGVEAAQRLNRLVNDYLDLKKIVSGNFELHREVVSLGAVAQTAITGLAIVAEQAGIQLSLNVGDNPLVDCDRDSIIQVLTNLIANAIKFSPRQSTINVVIEKAKDKARTRCSVSDRGPGIAAADIPRIFGMFQQTSTALTIDAKGTGLGLAISKSLVEQHGGQIGVESNTSGGSTFWFELQTY